MPLKTILWAGFFGAMCLAALSSPIWGIIGYVGHYSVGPEGQWWNAPLRPLEMRYSFTLAAFTAVGIALNWGKLRFGPSILLRQEKLLLLFLAFVWLSTIFGPETVGRYTRPGIDHPSMKLTKVVIFTLMLTHVVTDLKNLDRLLWALIIGALILGLQAWDTPYRAFESGRLEGVGGPDFSECNFFAAYMAVMLPIIGVQFLRSGGYGRLLCLASGVFTTNAIILTRSRSAVVGLAFGVLAAILLAPRRERAKIVFCLLLVLAGGLYLSDPQFLSRTATITRSEEERDTSAQSRIVLAKAGVRMLTDHPLGVGAGNFYQTIGRYVPEYAGADAHNTYVRCFTEVGLQGGLVLLLLIGSALAILLKVRRQAANLPASQRRDLTYLSFGLIVGISTLSGCFLTISLTYVEYVWWFLALPVCLQRVVHNLERESHTAPAVTIEEEFGEPDLECVLVE